MLLGHLVAVGVVHQDVVLTELRIAAPLTH